MMPTKSTKSVPAARKARTSRTPTPPAVAGNGTTEATARATVEISSAVIARRAYELFEASGAEHGHDLEHWLRAEQELLSAS